MNSLILVYSRDDGSVLTHPEQCSPTYREGPETVANTLRAFVGALWLDQGTTTSLQFLHRHVIPKIAVKVESKMKE